MIRPSRPNLRPRLQPSDLIGRDRDSHWPIDAQGGRYYMTSADFRVWPIDDEIVNN